MEEASSAMEEASSAMEEASSVMEEASSVMEEASSVMEEASSVMEEASSVMEDEPMSVYIYMQYCHQLNKLSLYSVICSHSLLYLKLNSCQTILWKF